MLLERGLKHFSVAADRKYVDGREIRVDWATKSDFKKFGWKWTEDDYSPSRYAPFPSPCIALPDPIVYAELMPRTMVLSSC